MTKEEYPAAAWRVRVKNERGVIEHQTVFPVRANTQAEKMARRHAERIQEVYRGCTIKVEPLCFYPELTL